MHMLFSIAMVTTLSLGMAAAQSPVAYVYVAEDGTLNDSTVAGPITVFAASSAGKLTPIHGSPFKQTEGGYVVGDTGNHFVTLDSGPTSHNYLRTYDVASDGAIGNAVAKQDIHEWCAGAQGATLDHSGGYVYVTDSLYCGGAVQTFALGSTGELTFKDSSSHGSQSLPAIAGNEKFAYTVSTGNDQACPTLTFSGLQRESDGDLNNYPMTTTGPSVPSGEEALVFSGTWVSPDPTNHLAALIFYGSVSCDQTSDPRLVSYTIQNNGDLVSTASFSDLPAVAAYPKGSPFDVGRPMSLNPAGDILAIAVGTGTQFFHFNGAEIMTKLTDVVGDSGFIATLAWDDDNHLYALNEATGRLHVYSATTTKVQEVAGSPYTVPYCGQQNGISNCLQWLTVHSVK